MMEKMIENFLLFFYSYSDDMLAKDAFVVDYQHFFEHVLELYLNDDVKQMLLVGIKFLCLFENSMKEFRQRNLKQLYLRFLTAESGMLNQ